MHRPGKQDLDCWLQKKERKQAKSVESEGPLLACVPVSCIEKGRSVAMKAKAEERGVSGKAGSSLFTVAEVLNIEQRCASRLDHKGEAR